MPQIIVPAVLVAVMAVVFALVLALGIVFWIRVWTVLRELPRWHEAQIDLLGRIATNTALAAESSRDD
jgi:Zn-dependent protease with chaperone function